MFFSEFKFYVFTDGIVTWDDIFYFPSILFSFFKYYYLEFPELEGTQRDHPSPALGPAWARPKNHTMCLEELSKYFMDSGMIFMKLKLHAKENCIC